MEEKNYENDSLSLENNGETHQAKVTYDSATGKLNAGIIKKLSENTGAVLQSIDGKIEGKVVHSGKNHKAELSVGPDGSLGGKIESKKGNLKFGVGIQKRSGETKGSLDMNLGF